MGLNIWCHYGFLAKMTAKEAMQILCAFSSTRSEINRNYRAILQGNHPDTGGSEYLAQKINEARNILLKRAR